MQRAGSVTAAVRLNPHDQRWSAPPPVSSKVRLAPWLYPGDIVVMDNLNIHKMRIVSEAIRDAGGFPVFLPTYSPELNPIERLWADINGASERSPSTPRTNSSELSTDCARRHQSRRSLPGSVIPYPRLESTDLGATALIRSSISLSPVAPRVGASREKL